jgi:poly-gamma-glutamate synthesis protein (capsule biosynthesis protein)
LVHSPLAAAALEPNGSQYDFDPMFAAVRPLIREADLALCHLETPLSRHNDDLSYYPLFRVPRGVVPALVHAGYDYCSVASNHSVDGGFSGVSATLDILDRAGIAHDGSARSPREGRRPAYLMVEGVRVALLSYTYGLNGLLPPEGAPWAVNLIDGSRIVADARRARRQGAEFVVVSLHWGVEYVAEPTPEQRELARRLTRSRMIDLVVGHHAHVVQPVDRVNGRLVLYGLGNFLSNQTSACCPAETQDGVLVHLRVREVGDRFRVTRILYTPTWMSHDPYRILPVTLALRDPDIRALLGDALRASFQRTTGAMRMLGEDVRATGKHFPP